MKDSSRPTMANVHVGGSILDLQVSTLPLVSRDLTDRNRTSPFAFTGNKFEFRAVGSKQSPSFPVCLLNTAVAASLVEMKAALEKQMGKKDLPGKEDILAVVRMFIKSSKNVRFEGNGYGQEWIDLAEKRGLLNIKSAPVAFKQLLEKRSIDLLVKQGVLTEKEIYSRYHILNEQYALNQLIEGNTILGMVKQSILPAAYEYRGELVKTVVAAVGHLGASKESQPEYGVFTAIGSVCEKLEAAIVALQSVIDEIDGIEDGTKKAEVAGGKLPEAMGVVRGYADELEEIVADKFWPYPKYTELLL
jgi:glutamine synthetase